MKKRMISHGTVRLSKGHPESAGETPARPEDIIHGVVERADAAFEQDIKELARLRADYESKVGKNEYSWINFEKLERHIKRIERKLPAKYRELK